MPEPFSIAKAADISIPTLGKAVSVVVKGLLVLGVIALIIWSIYVTIVKPHTKPTPTTTENAEIINHYYYYPIKKTFGVGFNILGMDIGLSKYDFPIKPVEMKEKIISKTEVKK